MLFNYFPGLYVKVASVGTQPDWATEAWSINDFRRTLLADEDLSILVLLLKDHDLHSICSLFFHYQNIRVLHALHSAEGFGGSSAH